MSPQSATADGLLLSDDLFFGSKVTGTASELGLKVDLEGDVVAALKKLRTGGYRCVIVDLAKRGLAVGDVMASLPPADPPHVIAFGAHVDVNRHDEARDAGCDQVFVRSRFTAALPQILSQYLSG
jgi:hypothetical protein